MLKTLLLSACLAIITCSNVSAENKIAGEAGTFQLITVNNGAKQELYRINTKTGEVWEYNEFVVLDENSLAITPKAKEGMRQLLEQAKKQGKNVYTIPHWQLTNEQPSEHFTIH